MIESILRGGCSCSDSVKAEERVLGREMEAAVGGKSSRQGMRLEADCIKLSW